MSDFADDVDPIVVEEIQPTDFEMLFDGSLYSFDKASAVMVHVSVIPGSEDDLNLRILLQTRKSGLSILPIDDVTSMSISYPDNGSVMFTGGTILKGPLADSIIQTGRKKSNTYTFVFASFGGFQSGLQTAVTIGQNLLALL